MNTNKNDFTAPYFNSLNYSTKSNTPADGDKSYSFYINDDEFFTSKITFTIQNSDSTLFEMPNTAFSIERASVMPLRKSLFNNICNIDIDYLTKGELLLINKFFQLVLSNNLMKKDRILPVSSNLLKPDNCFNYRSEECFREHSFWISEKYIYLNNSFQPYLKFVYSINCSSLLLINIFKYNNKIYCKKFINENEYNIPFFDINNKHNSNYIELKDNFVEAYYQMFKNEPNVNESDFSNDELDLIKLHSMIAY